MPAQLRTGDVRWQAAISARVTPGQVPLPATRKAISAALLSAGGAGLEAAAGGGVAGDFVHRLGTSASVTTANSKKTSK